MRRTVPMLMLALSIAVLGREGHRSAIAAGPQSGVATPVEIPADEVLEVFKDEVIDWVGTEPDVQEADGFVVRHKGHVLQRAMDMPPRPRLHREARRIVAVVRVDPVYSMESDRLRPNDKWTRLGTVWVETTADDGRRVETELMRFITGYGCPGVFEQDVTALAPMLYGRQTICASIASYSPKPGWRISLSLKYTADGVGARRPSLARHLFGAPHVTAQRSLLAEQITIPDGTDVPRLRIITSGHATDGTAENEFITCTHVLRVDGREIARWRPWSERGGEVRSLNPWAARQVVDGRELRSSDLDRSGWHPGLTVEPLIIPVPELTPGRHRIELEILGIRPPGPLTDDGKRHHGYWSVSATVIADDPWPTE